MHSARVLLFHTDPSGKFTTNSNKNIQFGIFALWKTLENYTITEGIPKLNIDGLENKLNYQSSIKCITQTLIL